MARHECLPVSMTPEQLADYIKTNRIESKNHVEKIPLTEIEKNELSRKSSNAGQQIKRLEVLLKTISDTIKNGTPWNSDLGTDGDNIPVDFTIPPTGGLKKLKANREYWDEQISKGYREDITTIYSIPWPEFEKIVAVNIEGEEWSIYSRKMTTSEIKQHGKPILKASADVAQFMEASGLEVERVDGKEVKITKKKKSEIDKMPPLSEAEQQELAANDKEDEPRIAPEEDHRDSDDDI